jgi:FAD binding domain
MPKGGNVWERSSAMVLFRENQDGRMILEAMSEMEGQQAYQEALLILGIRLRGELVLPGDHDYEAARSVWNGATDCHPALIVRCVDVADVIEAANFAREQAMTVSVRSGGHSPAGYGTNNGGMVIDLSQMKAIAIDPEQRIARIEPGSIWREVAEALRCCHGTWWIIPVASANLVLADFFRHWAVRRGHLTLA